LLESLEIAGRKPGVGEDVLDWPIFGENYDRSRIESLLFNPQVADYNTILGQDSPGSQQAFHPIRADPIRTSRPGRGIQEDDVLLLVNKFLVNVHIKNPIVDADDLKRKARWTVEHGFGWDTTSCLVVGYS
jgi:hypothetical protein